MSTQVVFMCVSKAHLKGVCASKMHKRYVRVFFIDEERYELLVRLCKKAILSMTVYVWIYV